VTVEAELFTVDAELLIVEEELLTFEAELRIADAELVTTEEELRANGSTVTAAEEEDCVCPGRLLLFPGRFTCAKTDKLNARPTAMHLFIILYHIPIVL